MKPAAILLSFVFLTSFLPAPAVRVIGFYSNEKSKDGEHSYGYSLKLWKYNNKVIGIVSFNEGLIGDQADERINDVNFSDATGALSFSSTLAGQKLHFRGKVQSARVTGNFSWPSRTDSKQVLKSCCKDAFIYRNYATLSEWEKEALYFK